MQNRRRCCSSSFFFQLSLLMILPKGLCLCSLWTTLWMIISLHHYYSSAHHGTSTQTQTERLDSSVLHYGFIISTVSCLEMCSKYRTSSITLGSCDVKQFIYRRFYWWLKNGVLVIAFQFQICKWVSNMQMVFHLWFLAGRGLQGFDLRV